MFQRSNYLCFPFISVADPFPSAIAAQFGHWRPFEASIAAENHVVLGSDFGANEQAAAAAPNATCVLALAGVKRNVLVVDDSPICQKVLVKVLSSAGYQCQCAGNGVEALELLSLEPLVVPASFFLPRFIICALFTFES